MSAPAKPAAGTLDGAHVVVPDTAAANRLHNKSLAGVPQPGNRLRLSLVEAAHCVASGWLTVTDSGQSLSAAGLVARSQDGRRALDDFLAYRDLRERGFVARHAPGTSHFDVWPRGTAEGKPLFQVVAVSAADPVTTADLLDGAKGELVCCVVDEDSAVTHYRLAFAEPAGKVPQAKMPRATGTVVADRVLLTDPAAIAACTAESLGTPQGDALLLSPLEAVALQDRGLRIDGTLPSTPPPEVLQGYAALRKAGVVVKSGLRFGTHLRAYVGAPDETHADWLVHCAKADGALAWSDLARGVRLAHGVRKQFLLSIPASRGVRFVHVAWFRP